LRQIAGLFDTIFSEGLPVALKSKSVLQIVAVVVVIAAAAVFYLINRSHDSPLATAATGQTAAEAAAAADVTKAASSDLMVAGPLGEKTLGDPKAPNVVIEYASLTCTHCQRFHQEVYGPFKAKYIDTGKVYFILREFPLDPLATSAVMLARCAPGDNFFPLIDLLFDHQAEWAFVDNPADALLNLVKQAGFTQDSFRTCLTNQQILDGVNWVKDRAAQKFGVNATPTFFVNGEKKPGEQSMDDFAKLLGS
jgi:protein-disulfide isomerase